MKNLSKILLLLIVGITVSCDQDLDINTDPNFPGQINRGLSLTAAESSLVSVVGGELTNLGGFYAQYHTQAPSASQYENTDSYNLNTAYANSIWTELYAGCLKDLQYVTREATAEGDTSTLLIAEVLRAYTFQLLVDLFDAVPYTEALNFEGGIITPRVTPGQEIYADLLVKIDAAVAAYNANPSENGVGSQDVIFGADMDKWIQFANTLKLKMYLRMAYTPNANPAAVNELIAQNNFLEEDAKFENFAATTNKRNPFYENTLSQTGLGDVNNVASNTLMNFYTENDDPRREAAYRYVFKANDTLPSVYRSIPQGSGQVNTGVAAAYSRPNVRPTTPVFLMSLAESNFLQAEANIRYAGGNGAKEKYDAGIVASFATYEANFFTDNEGDEERTRFTVSDSVVQAKINGPYAYVNSGSVEASVRQVIVQKWASLAYINNIEAWIESTRTKYPEVVEEGTQDYAIGNRIPSQLSILSGTQIPSILFYPDSEVNRNPNITQRGSTTENVWWDRKPE
jgi:hypothetical protein